MGWAEFEIDEGIVNSKLKTEAADSQIFSKELICESAALALHNSAIRIPVLTN